MWQKTLRSQRGNCAGNCRIIRMWRVTSAKSGSTRKTSLIFLVMSLQKCS